MARPDLDDSSREDWRSAVADYTTLYTNETFSRLRPDASLEAIELGAVGQSVGAKLTPEIVAQHGLSDEDLWDVIEIAAMFNFTNRMADATGMLPNPEYHALAR